MPLLLRIVWLPAEFLMEIAGGSPVLVILVYFLALLFFFGALIFVFIKRKSMEKRSLIFLLVIWLICLGFLFINLPYMILWLAMWVCALMGGGSGCYL